MIDWDKFNEYLGSYDTKFIVTELIGDFLISGPERVSAIGKNVEEMDFPGLDFNAHSLKSNCAYFGDTESAELAFKLELMGKNQSDDDMKGVYRQLAASVDNLIQELKQYKKQHPC
ncbi:MAG: Hpt domain-containing protein [Bacteroidetes bacterium]|nr:Hpt domain-containing protein [Bacteroidota bacterium]